MLRLAFILCTTVPIVGVIVLVSAWLPEQIASPVIVGGVVVYVVAALAAYYLLMDRFRPKSDVTRVRVQLGGAGKEVLSVVPAGVRLGGRSGPDYRVYTARVRMMDGSEVDHTVSVEATLLGDGQLQDQRRWDRPIDDPGVGLVPARRRRADRFGPGGLAALLALMFAVFGFRYLVDGLELRAAMHDVAEIDGRKGLSVLAYRTPDALTKCGAYIGPGDTRAWRFYDGRAGTWTERRLPYGAVPPAFADTYIRCTEADWTVRGSAGQNNAIVRWLANAF